MLRTPVVVLGNIACARQCIQPLPLAFAAGFPVACSWDSSDSSLALEFIFNALDERVTVSVLDFATAVWAAWVAWAAAACCVAWDNGLIWEGLASTLFGEI
jgi:hypothetical protein